MMSFLMGMLSAVKAAQAMSRSSFVMKSCGGGEKGMGGEGRGGER